MDKKKRNYWPLFFIGIFGFTFSMIVWTIKSSVSISTTPDTSFMKKYQDVDEHFNEMMESNKQFLAIYDFEMFINNNKFLLTTDDIKYSQRVLEKISLHKDSLKVGQNNIKIIVTDKLTKEAKDLKIELVISKSIAEDSDFVLKNEDFKNDNKIYSSDFQLKDAHNWIITGSFIVDGITGYIYIKTNAI
jgi:hypothetical protein